MKLSEYVDAVTGKPNGQYAILIFDIGVCGAAEPPVTPFANNYKSENAASIRGPWMATSKNEMAQNTAVHTETMLLNQLPNYLEPYIEQEGRRPYSLGLYSYYSPCRHCVRLLTGQNSIGYYPELDEWGFKSGSGFNSPLSLRSAFGLTFFNFKKHYVNEAKHQKGNLKSWYSSRNDSLAAARDVQAAGWEWALSPAHPPAE